MNAYSRYLSYKNKKTNHAHRVRVHIQTIGLAIIALALGGIIRPMLPSARLELGYQIPTLIAKVQATFKETKTLPASAPIMFNPLIDENGADIVPITTDFSLIVPKIGINAPVIPAVDPTNRASYTEALATGVAHASTSFFPDENGLVYLFSHSTNYEWFVDDLNAVFYLVKNLEKGDIIVLVYKNVRYTYTLTHTQVVEPTDISYLAPIEGSKQLILQTCWPPGSTTKRLLVFAKLIDTHDLNTK